MGADGWYAFYHGEAQALWLLLLPALFLAWRLTERGTRGGAVDPRASGFVALWALFFAIEALLDVIATGPLVRALGLEGTLASKLLLFVFVLLGDFRVFVLLLFLAGRERVLRESILDAARLTALVPLVAGVGFYAGGSLVGGFPGQVLWLFYEVAFVAVALYLRERWIPARVPPESAALRDYLRAVSGFVALYYALWAASDLLILAGVDGAWGLRALTNQLYYGLFVPFAWWKFRA